MLQVLCIFLKTIFSRSLSKQSSNCWDHMLLECRTTLLEYYNATHKCVCTNIPYASLVILCQRLQTLVTESYGWRLCFAILHLGKYPSVFHLCCAEHCWVMMHMWLDLRKPSFHIQLQIFRNTDFNYLKYYNLVRKTDTCMKFATIQQLFIIYLFTNYRVNS